MVDFAASARRLYRRMVDRTRTSSTDALPGTPSEADGASAVAAVEAWVSDGAGLGASFPAAAAARRFRLEAGSGLNLDRRLPAALIGAGPRGGFAAAVGLATAGQRAAAFLSGPDLLAAQDLLDVAARRMLPLVVHLTARAGTGPAEALGSDHRAYHAAAASGALQLFAADVQEAVDLTLIARRVAEEALLPALVAMDGPETALSVQDFLLPEPETVRRFLGGPGEPVHPPTASQEMLFGKHRRRVPRWHDPERPAATGAAQGPEAFALAAAARRLVVDPHLPGLLAQACDAFAATTGRRYGPLRTHRVDGARVLLVAQGSAVETAEAVADHVRAAHGLKVGVVGVRTLRPFPAAELAEILRGRRRVAVLERVDAPLVADAPVLAEIRALSEVSPLVSVLYGLGGLPVRGADLAALCRRLAAKDSQWPRRLYLGLDAASTGAAYPKREALRDALERAYPEVSDLGLRSAEPAEIRPELAFTVAVSRAPGSRSGALAEDLAILLRRLAGGHLRTRRDLGWERWGAARCDTVTWSPEPVRGPADDVAAELAVWSGDDGSPDLLRRVRDGGAVVLAGEPGGGPSAAPVGAEDLRRAAGDRGLRLYADLQGAGGTVGPAGGDRLLGALAGILAAEDKIEIKLRKLLATRREMLEEDGEGDVEARLDELQAGFEGVSRIEIDQLAEGSAEPAADAGPPAAVRRLGKSGAPVSDLSDFWGRTGMLYRDGETAALLPDPFLAAGTVPPVSAALRAAGPRAMLPAFDPAACTGCGDCWTACPHAALGPAILGASAVLDHGMGLAKGRGRATDKLRMVTSKLAAAVGMTMAAEGWAGDLAGPLLDAAFEPLIAKMKLPDKRKAGIREAYAAVRDEIAHLPVARTAPFFDRAVATDRGELFTLAVDPDACKGCGLCIAACEPEALTAVADAPRRSAAAGEVWRLVEDLPAPTEATVGRARQDPEVGPLAGALLTAAARGVMTRGDGAEAGSGEALALRQVLGTAAFHLRPRHEELVREIGEVRQKLAETIHDGLSRALPDRDLDALSRGLDALHQPDADLADLTSRVEAAFETDRVDVSRTRRLVAAARDLADLERRLGGGDDGPRSGVPGRALFGLVVGAGERAPAWAGAFPHNPFAVPVTVAAAGDAGDLARGILEGQLRQTLEVVRAIRRARLELASPNGPRPADLEILDRLGWRDLEPGERRFCPPVFLVASEDAITAHAGGLAGLLGALAVDLPIKLVVLADSDRVAGEAPFDLGLLASTERGASFLQTSIAAGDHLEGGVAAALAHDGPAFLRVYAPSAEGHPTDATLARAREAWAPPDASDRPDESDESDAPAPAPDAAAPDAAAPDAAAPDAAAIAALEQRHAAELAALRGGYEARIAGLRASFQQETAQRIRSRLLQLATAQRPAAEAPPEAQGEDPPT